MKLNTKCIVCNIQQAIRIAEFLDVDDKNRENIMRKVLGYLRDADYGLSNPQIMKGTWDIIVEELGNDNPYKDIKRFYNEEMLMMYNELMGIVKSSKDSFQTGLKMAITGNLIDFGPSHKFDRDILIEMINNLDSQNMVVDDSKKLKDMLADSHTLLYIGDNCGEIVLDKVFIEQIKSEFPKLDIYFGVRGKAIINDVTLEDAKMVKMEEVASIIESEDGTPGTILENTGERFQKMFESADVIIAKGQGNYESLSDVKREGLFFLFMAKCPVVAGYAGVDEMSILCMENAK
ncbi:hypothetical protein SAMN02745945_02832 [Peptoclostridium litorale DSM 5388]|uniref:Damage-control phosphatase ARMT1-like metal-binding domain-containing protein n=1 Tax=Peptoclostridium litorale DSM 5388 TaxID=1121324 RepID=A0A069RIE3_PEPLI|nr:ARMT1-like domain-containing protein [Peptoclostridium litorale]KDR96786.1 hypothetical protein CLIT_2c03920 [Peptoclostridium litorale DSM 5388]SIO34387.1 hypothetical protein SAMN02745945_02832 [Peptoclostridium litorale DSM 5388]